MNHSMDDMSQENHAPAKKIFLPRLRPGWMGRLWRNGVCIYRRVVRQPGSPEYIARGVVVGVIISLILPVGQFPAALLFAYLVRGSRPAALIATLPVNPLTGTIVYPLEYALGCALMGLSPLGTLPDTTEDWLAILVEPTDAKALYAYLLGTVVCSLVSIWPVYNFTRVLVVKYRLLKERRRARKLAAQAAEAATPLDPPP